MKHLLLLLALFSFTMGTAQAPKGMVKIDMPVNHYSEAAERSAAATDVKHQQELKAYANQLAAVRDSQFPGARQLFIISSSGYKHVQTNDPVIDKLLDQFYDGAVHYYIDYYKQLQQLKKVEFVKADRFYLAEFSRDGSTLKMNSLLATRQYENLRWVIFYNQLGQRYGLKLEKKGHGIMSKHWEIDKDHENYAKARRLHNKNVREEYFKAIQKKHGLKKKL